MIKIYGAPPTRGLRPIWMCEEMGLEYQLQPVTFQEMRSPEFRAINPAGFVPVLDDGEVRLLESVAMLQYLAARHGPTPLAPEPSHTSFAAYLQFLHLGEAGLAALLNVVVASRIMAPEAQKENFGRHVAEASFFNRLKLVEAQLERGPYLAGDVFTAADISVCYALGLAGRIGLAERIAASVQAYLDRMSQRPAFQRAAARTAPLMG